MFDFIFGVKKVSPLREDEIFADPVYQKQLTQRAIVTTKIAPSQPGRVYYHGTSWFALCEQDLILEKDTLVYVKERKGNILIVDTFTCNIEERLNLNNNIHSVDQENALIAEVLMLLLL